MATAEELLALSVGSEDKVCVIDNDLRTINIPKTITALGVEYDDDVHRLHFRMPRYIGDIDLSTFVIRINYLNANNEGDIYMVTDKKSTNETITFSWLVGRHAFIYKGNVNFIVCMVEVDPDGGEVQREYNTTVATLPVLEGLEVEHSEPISGELIDILAQLPALKTDALDSIEAVMWDSIYEIEDAAEVEKNGVTEHANYLKSTFGDDYDTTVKQYRTRATAITETVQGENIIVDDASDDRIRDLKIFGKSTQVTTTGKNLYDVYDQREYHFKGTVGDSDFVTNSINNVSGTAITYSNTYSNPQSLLKTSTNYRVVIEVTSISNATLNVTDEANSSKSQFRGTWTITAPGIYVKTLTTVDNFDESETCLRTFISVSPGLSGNATFRVSILEDLSVTADNFIYEPYSGGVSSPSPEFPQELISIGEDDEMQVWLFGKNLLCSDTTRTATLANGVTFKSTKDSSEYIFNGTAVDKNASGLLVQRMTIPPGTYTCSVRGLSAGSNSADYINMKLYNESKYVFTGLGNKTSRTFTFEETTDVIIEVVVCIGSIYTNSIVTVQVETGTAVTTHEQYAGVQNITTSHVLSAVPVTTGGNYTDENGQQWVCDEIDYSRGVHIQRIGTKVFDGSADEIWHDDALVLDNTIMFRIEISDSVNVGNVVGKDYLCNNFPVKNMYNSDIEGTQHTMRQFYFRIAKSTLDTVDRDGFRAYLSSSPMTVRYILATPIETPLTSAELAAYNVLHTNYPNTVVLNDAGAHMELKYNVDTKTYVDNLPGASDEQIADAVNAYLEENPASGAKPTATIQNNILIIK